MASFTDRLPEFNPYVAQLPVEAMVQVGMEKQRRYDEGIQKIQSSIDQIGGLDVARDVDKAYLQSKINQLGNNLKGFMASDFSDSQLTNSVAGMSKKLYSDPNIQTAVASTANYRKQVGLMEEARAKGELTPENEAFFGKQAASWMNGTEVNQPFNGKYVPYFDVDKYTRETFNALKPDGYSFDQIFETDSSGNVLRDRAGKPVLSHTMKRLEKEGIFPEKVKATIDQIFSEPKVSQQLNITGQYVYRGVDDATIVNKVQQQKQQEINQLEGKLFELNLSKAVGENVDLQIDQVRSAADKAALSYDEYIEMAKSNPDAIRGTIYKDEVRGRYTQMFGNVKTKEQIMDNPAFKMEFELNKEENRRAEWQWDANFKTRRAEAEDAWKQRNYELDVFKAQTDAKKAEGKGKGAAGAGSTDIEASFESPYSQEDADTKIVLMGDNRYTSAANSYSASRDRLIWDTMYAPNPNSTQRLENLKASEARKGNVISDNQAISILLKGTAKQYGQNIETFRTEWMKKIKDKVDANKINLTPELRTQYTTTLEKEKAYKQELGLKKQREDVAIAQASKLGFDEELKNIKNQRINYRGADYNLSPQDQVDIAAYIGGNNQLWGAGNSSEENGLARQAKTRLDQKGLGALADRYLQDYRLGNGAAPISMTAASVGTVGSNIKDWFTGGEGDYDKITMTIDKLVTAVKDKNYASINKTKAEMIKRQYNVNPDRTYTLNTGDAEGDRGLKYQLSTFATSFQEGGRNQNLASKDDFKAFQESFSDKDASYNIQSDTDAYGNPKWSVVYEKDGKIAGKMVLNDDQAAVLGYNAADIFENNRTLMLRNEMNTYGGKTSVGMPSDIATYKNTSDYFYDKDAGDFKNVTDRNVTVRANISTTNGQYYPYIYVRKGNVEKVQALPPVSNAAQLDEYINTGVNDQLINAILKK